MVSHVAPFRQARLERPITWGTGYRERCPSQGDRKTIVAEIIEELQWRGLLAQTTDIDELRKALADGPITLYCGFDPTAGSLHVGHLLQILTLARFQRSGHRPIALVGGATGLIGDPKPNAERSLNSLETIQEWVGNIRSQLSAFLRFADSTHTAETADSVGAGMAGNANDAILANNADWLTSMSALELLRDVGKHFSLNQMLQRDTVRTRLAGSGMSYTEFSYVLLQAYDYLELYRRYGCTLQSGGSDQWGNITSGLELIRRVLGNEPHGPAHGLTTNLLTKSDGTKFGKTEGGTVWLDPRLTSPYAFYQFWFNTGDSDVVDFLRTFTFRTRTDIEELALETRERPARRAAQRALAEEMTRMVHGDVEYEQVRAASQALFGQGTLIEVDDGTLGAALREVPHTVVSAGEYPPLVDLLVRTGLVTSKSAARRAIQEGGAYLNNDKVRDVDASVVAADMIHGRYLVLRRGKRHVAGVVLSDD